MQTYSAPLRDMRFVLHELHEAPPLPGHEEFTTELVDTILEEAAKFCTENLLPLNVSGDLTGCTYENGVVRTPPGFREAYQGFTQAGWGALNADPQYGGQGAPETVAKMVEEMICSCNLSFGLYPGLSHGAALALQSHGATELKDFYLPKLVSGIWSGTMCLTEPQCGTDLGMLRTKATPQEDGSYSLTGSKIFISAGEHDLAENIVHLVLARMPDAPAGIKGISLFLVPKFLPDAQGNPGKRNGVSCSAIEHKMGLKASATCQLNFDEATGWLVGAPHKGMAAMFTMMNSERLSVGTQGLGLGEISYQSAVAYARERLQGRALSGPKHPELAADPIIVHPDIRKSLLTMRAYNEGCRALCVWVAQAMDRAAHAASPDERAAADDFVALMTPIVKALFTDMGFESANLAVQVYGGHGYIRDHGIEQLVRDARIAMIYEGTNGIQALDLVGRKMPANMGRSLRRFFHPAAEFIANHADDPHIGKLVQGFGRAFGALQLATGYLAERSQQDAEEAGAAATDYLRLFGLVALGFMWVRMARIAADKADGDEADFYTAKLNTARFYIERILPQAGALLFTIKAGKAAMMEMAEAAF